MQYLYVIQVVNGYPALHSYLTPLQAGGCESQGQLLYSLFGVVEHSGGMHGGHYIAYVRLRNRAQAVNMDYGNLSSTEAQPDAEGSDCVSSDTVVKDGAGPTQPPSTASTDLNESQSATAFDRSSTGGQWYYISDSHVRTATETEVLKSQAYILFYEQLPLIQQVTR